MATSRLFLYPFWDHAKTDLSAFWNLFCSNPVLNREKWAKHEPNRKHAKHLISEKGCRGNLAATSCMLLLVHFCTFFVQSRF